MNIKLFTDLTIAIEQVRISFASCNYYTLLLDITRKEKDINITEEAQQICLETFKKRLNEEEGKLLLAISVLNRCGADLARQLI